MDIWEDHNDEEREQERKHAYHWESNDCSLVFHKQIEHGHEEWGLES